MRPFSLWMLILIALSAPSVLMAQGSETCRQENAELPWSEIQAQISPLFRQLKFKVDEKPLADAFLNWSTDLKSKRYTQIGLKLSHDVQKHLSNSRHPSPAIKLLWSSLLLATEQRDVAFRSMSKLPKSDLLQFMRAESQKSGDAFSRLDVKDPLLRVFAAWRKSEESLRKNKLTDSWSYMKEFLGRRPQTLFSSDRYEKRIFLLLAKSRLDPHDFWANLPKDLDREWLSVCVLEERTFDNQKNAAFLELRKLPSVTEMTLRFAYDASQRLNQAKISKLSRLAWFQANLRFMERSTKEAAASVRWRELEAITLELGKGLLTQLSFAEGESLSQALGSYLNKYPSHSYLKLRAEIYESIGHWKLAAADYRTLRKDAKTPYELTLYTEAWLNNAQKSAPILEQDDEVLVGEAALRAKRYLEACDAVSPLSIAKEQDIKDCSLYSIRFAMNQKKEEQAVRLLWLFVARFPREAGLIVEPMLNLFAKDPERLMLACEKFLLIPEVQKGPQSELLWETLRQSKLEVARKTLDPLDRAEALVHFAETERPHPSALLAMDEAIQLSAEDWRRQVRYLQIYREKFPEGPNRLIYTLLDAEIHERNFALDTARGILLQTEHLPWDNEQQRARALMLCRLQMLDAPLLSITTCKKAMIFLPDLAINLATQLSRFGETTALHAFVTSEDVKALALDRDKRAEILSIGFEGTESAPNLQNDIKTLFFDHYVEWSEKLSPTSRRLYSKVAFQYARQSLSLYLNAPIFASVPDDLIPSIQAKRSAYTEVETLYQRVLQTKDAYWGASALSDLARASANISDSLNHLPPIEGLDPKIVETEIKTSSGLWLARGKSFAGGALKTLENFQLLHENARSLVFDMDKLRGKTILWEDRMPEWGSDETL